MKFYSQTMHWFVSIAEFCSLLLCRRVLGVWVSKTLFRIGLAGDGVLRISGLPINGSIFSFPKSIRLLAQLFSHSIVCQQHKQQHMLSRASHFRQYHDAQSVAAPHTVSRPDLWFSTQCLSYHDRSVRILLLEGRVGFCKETPIVWNLLLALRVFESED